MLEENQGKKPYFLGKYRVNWSQGKRTGVATYHRGRNGDARRLSQHKTPGDETYMRGSHIRGTEQTSHGRQGEIPEWYLQKL